MAVEYYEPDKGGYSNGWVVTSGVYNNQKLAIIDHTHKNKRVFFSVNDNFTVDGMTDGISGSGAYMSVDNIKEIVLILQIALKSMGEDIEDF